MAELTAPPEVGEVRSYIQRTFAEVSGLPETELFTADTSLAAVISRSPRMTNSIDLMEAFARTSNAVRATYGVRVRLPALPLDTSVTTVVDAFLAEFASQRKGTE
jgi:hypothetical protein